MNTYSLRDKKFEYQKRLNDILKKYYLRLFKKIYNNMEKKSIKDFQKKILEIKTWDNDKINSQYKKFLKFILKKYSFSEEDVYRMLDVVFILNLKIMATLFGDVEINVPEPKIFWYNCLKSTSKYIYENPKKIKHNLDIDINNEMHEIINNVIQKYIPLKDIIESKKESINFHDFNNCNVNDLNENNENNENDNDNQTNKISKLQIIKSKESNSDSDYNVPYISSDESELKDKSETTNNDSKSHDKYIKLPKNKKDNPYDQYKSIRINNKNAKNENDFFN